MGDYCIRYKTCPCGDKVDVTLIFMREELLYDIKNYAYIEGHVMGEEKQHAQHTLVDIGEEGNVDRVNRVLAVVHAGVVEMLYPYTKEEVAEDVIDNMMEEPEEYAIEMRVPRTMSITTIRFIAKLIHEYMVYKVIADWLHITNPQAASHWEMKANEMAEKIQSAKNHRTYAFTRKTHPW